MTPPHNPAQAFEDYADVGLTGSRRPVKPAKSAAPDPKQFTVSHWLDRPLDPPDFLLGELLSTTSRAMLVGPTGSGKTNFAMALNFAMARGIDFLHWKGRRAAKRLAYFDGEMSRRLIKERLIQAVDRLGAIPDNLTIINRDDYPMMPPLNTPEGQKFIDWILAQIGGVEFATFDNVQSLLVGDMKEEDAWSSTLPWIRDLTRRSIGQAWLHHTGHDATKSYGTKTREWQLDIVGIMKEHEKTDDTLISFDLEFTKARERSPSNRADFATARIWLGADDQWQSSIEPNTRKTKQRPLAPEDLKALDYLKDVVAEHGKTGLAPGIPANISAIHLDSWKDYLKQRGLHEGGDKGKHWFQRARSRLIAANRITVEHQYVWLVKK